MDTFVFHFINMLASILMFAIIIRALLSWFAPSMDSAPYRLLLEITEPVLAPIRRVMPSFGPMDFSPLIAIVLLQLVTQFVH